MRTAKVSSVSEHTTLLGASGRRWKGVGSADARHVSVRQISWTPRATPRTVEFNGLSHEQEDAAKAAILEKVMKGRQPTDLMLRCKSFTVKVSPSTQLFSTGTILDAEGIFS